jgi:hypothetical protein
MPPEEHVRFAVQGVRIIGVSARDHRLLERAELPQELTREREGLPDQLQ